MAKLMNIHLVTTLIEEQIGKRIHSKINQPLLGFSTVMSTSSVIVSS